MSKGDWTIGFLKRVQSHSVIMTTLSLNNVDSKASFWITASIPGFIQFVSYSSSDPLLDIFVPSNNLAVTDFRMFYPFHSCPTDGRTPGYNLLRCFRAFQTLELQKIVNASCSVSHTDYIVVHVEDTRYLLKNTFVWIHCLLGVFYWNELQKPRCLFRP